MLGGSALSGRDDLYAEGRGSDRDEVIPVAEEELHVGKREVSHGRVRIRSHVTERPVQEQVSLREEHVSVERRPVEGTMRTGSANNGDLFRERSIEMEERSEEAMVSKEARVVEEVVVRKDADRRTETVSDTVRKTEVEVDDERRSSGVPRTGTTDKNR
ncbi:YsnF/AvaK domain-containing protein [Microvirga splendida]